MSCIFNHLKSSISLGKLQNILVEQLYMCVEFLWKSERYELIADVNKPIIAVFEKQRDFKVCALYPEKAMEFFNLSWHANIATFSLVHSLFGFFFLFY